MNLNQEQIPKRLIYTRRSRSLLFVTEDMVDFEEADTSGPPFITEDKIGFEEVGTSGSSPRIMEDSSTDKPIIPEILERSIVELCDSADADIFEYGYKSQFAKCIEETVLNYGVDAIEAIQQYLFSGHLNEDVVIETLHTLGGMKHVLTHHARLLMLLKGLFFKSARVRCGSALGLADLDDPKAIFFLIRAMEKETSPSGRNCLKRVLEQLENTYKNA